MIGPVFLSIFPLMALAMALRAFGDWSAVGDKRFFAALAGGGIGAAGLAIPLVRGLLHGTHQEIELPVARAVTILAAPPIEEGLKGAALLMISWVLPWDDRRVGLVVGAITGLAFAMTENIHYFVRAGGVFAFSASQSGPPGPGPMGVLLQSLPSGQLLSYVLERLLTVSIMHGVASSWIGAALAGRDRGAAFLAAMGALCAATCLHAGWNLTVWLAMRNPIASVAGSLFVYVCVNVSAILFVTYSRPRGVHPL